MLGLEPAPRAAGCSRMRGMQVSRDDILRYRVRTQQLDGTASGADAAVLDVGVVTMERI